jgi:AcrR family transcriptional regulator
MTQSRRAGPAEPAPPPRTARERVLRAAYDLFCRHGVQAVGVDRIVAEAGVAKMTLYKHFRSKEELIVATLELRGELWTRGWLGRSLAEHPGPPGATLLAIFDNLDEWVRSDDFDGCLFNNSLLETHDADSPVRAGALEQRTNVRELIRELADAAGAPAPETLARDFQLLMTGTIVAAEEGDLGAPRRARRLAELLLQAEGVVTA